MKFYDDEPIVCEECGKTIYPGDDYYEYGDLPYCSEECVKDAMWDCYENDVYERHLNTAEDKALIYADMQWDEMKGEKDGSGNL